MGTVADQLDEETQARLAALSIDGTDDDAEELANGTEDPAEDDNEQTEADTARDEQDETASDDEDEYPVKTKAWESTGQREYKDVPVTGFKVLDDTKGVVEAMVSVTGILDRVKDVIEPGAYEKTLAARTPKGVWSHQWDQPVSKTLDVVELLPGDSRLPAETKDGQPWPRDAGALLVTTQFNLDGARGQQAYADVKFFGAEQEWSIGYNVPPGGARVESKTGIRRIQHLDLFEYSPVLFGAMPEAVTTDVKTAQTAYRAMWDGFVDTIESKRVTNGRQDQYTKPTPAAMPATKPSRAPVKAPPPAKAKAPAPGSAAALAAAAAAGPPPGVSSQTQQDILHPHVPSGATGGQFAKKGSGGKKASSTGTAHAHKTATGKTVVHAHSNAGAHTHPNTAGPGGSVKVTKGMTLWALAGKLLGDPTRWREIAALNHVKDPRQLVVGSVLHIPGGKPAVHPSPKAKPKAKTPAPKTIVNKPPVIASRTHPIGQLNAGPVPAGQVNKADEAELETKGLPVYDEADNPVYDHDQDAQPPESLNEDHADQVDDGDAVEDEKASVEELNDDGGQPIDLASMKDDPGVAYDALVGEYEDHDELEFQGAKVDPTALQTKSFVLDGPPVMEVKRGNAETLRRYWAEGEGAAKIRWGEGGDFDRCVTELEEYMPGRAKGYCNLLHHRATGIWPATHAEELGKSAEATLEEFGVKTAYLSCVKCHSSQATADGHCANCGAKLAPKFGAKQCPTCETETKTIFDEELKTDVEFCETHGRQSAVWELKDVTTGSAPGFTSLGFGGGMADTSKAAVITHCPICGRALDDDGDCPNGDYSNASKAAAVSVDERRKLADSGEAMPDGSFPIKDKDHLDSAVHLFQSGHTGADAEKTKAHIKKRAAALGASVNLGDEKTLESGAVDIQNDYGSAPPAASDYKYCPMCGGKLDGDPGSGYCPRDRYNAKIDDVDIDAFFALEEQKIAAQLLGDMAYKLLAGAEPDRDTIAAVVDSLNDILATEPEPAEKSADAVDMTKDLMDASIFAFKASDHLAETKDVMPPFSPASEDAPEEKWSAAQLRDWHGRWSREGGGATHTITQGLMDAMSRKPSESHVPAPTTGSVLKPTPSAGDTARSLRAARGVPLAGAAQRSRVLVPAHDHGVQFVQTTPGRSFRADQRTATAHAEKLSRLVTGPGDGAGHEAARVAHEGARARALDAGKPRIAAYHEQAAAAHALRKPGAGIRPGR